MQTSSAGDPQAEVLAALSARLERPIYPDVVIPTESQLFRGYLVLEGGTGYFLCQRFGRWEVHTEFDAATAKGVEVLESFGGSGFEVRLLDRGQLVRFGGLDEATARGVIASLASAGGEGRRPRKQPKAAQQVSQLGEGSAIVSGGASLGGGTGSALSFGAGRSSVAEPASAASALGSAASASLAGSLGRLAAAAERREAKPTAKRPAPPASPWSTPPKSWGERAIPEDDDEDDDALTDDDELEDDELEDDDEDELEDEDAFTQDPEVAAALVALEAREGAAGESPRSGAQAAARAAARTKAAAAAGPKVRPIVRMIVAQIVHTLLAVAVYESDVVHVAEDLAGDPEFGYAVFPVISWVLFAVAGGLGSGSLGRGLAMLVYGILAGLAVVFGYQVTNDPWALHALAWFIIGWGYMRTREGEAPFVRAAITTLGVFVIANALEASAFADGAVVVFGAFWLAHYFWERQESAAKKG